MKLNTCKQIIPAALTGMVLSGCVVQRGVDFGHWAKKPERINVIRVRQESASTEATGQQSILIMPLFGKVEDEHREQLESNLYHEMQNYFGARMISLSRHGELKPYLKEKNLMPLEDMIEYSEAARLGRILGFSHVLCVNIRQWRPYPPQIISLFAAMVSVASGRPDITLSANFDASEQQVMLMLDRHLQQRSARKYNNHSLNIVQRSPSQYSSFVFSECVKTLADKYSKKELKKNNNKTDNPDRGRGGSS